MIPLHPDSSPQFTQATLPHPQIRSVQSRDQDKDSPYAAFSNHKDHERFSRNQATAHRALTGERLIRGRSPYPAPGDAPRTNYPHAPGQLVMGHSDLSETHELDHHGNAWSNNNAHLHSAVGPQFSNLAEHIWNTKGVSQHVRTDTVIHTGQHADETDYDRHNQGTQHRYIVGPLDQSKPMADVAHVDGMPFLADGHHRLAESRGRGESSIHVRTLDVDKVKAEATPGPKVSHKTPDAMYKHLLNDHLQDHNSLEASRSHADMHRALHHTLVDHFHSATPETR